MEINKDTVKPSHVFSLSDGTNTLNFLTINQRYEVDVNAGFSQAPMPRTPLKLSQGAAKYEDFELPFTSIIQEDFSGGMLAEDFEDDRTKFRDGRHCDTTRGDVICGPKPTRTSLLGMETFGDLDWTVHESAETADVSAYASTYTPSSNMTVKAVKGIVYILESVATIGRVNSITVKAAVYADSGGNVGALQGSGEVTIEGTNQKTYAVEVFLNTGVSLTSGTQYWIAFYFEYADKTGFVFRSDSGEQINKYAEDSGAWAARLFNYSIPFILLTSSKAIRTRLFEHRRVLYAVASYDDGSSAPILYMNGYRGVVSSANANYSKLNTDADLSVDADGDALDLTGKILLLIGGPGSLEEKPWRKIISNTTTGTNDVITVGEPWKTQPTTDTAWVVLGTDDWWEIAGHGLTEKITDVCIVYDYVALAQGGSEPIRKFRWTNASGHEFSDDGTNAFDLLLMVADTEGAMNLWGADIEANTVDSAPAQYYATNHTFEGKDIKIGTSLYDDIRNMIAYGDPLIPYVIKENSFGSIQNDIYAEVPIGELDEVRSVYNGIAAMKFGVYLYFNLGEMIERYYDRRLDDVGPNRDEGMPAGRNGIVRKLLAYPGRYYALIFKADNTPSILCHNGMGWHEIWRPTSVSSDGSGDTGEAEPYAYNVSDAAGGRCTDMIVQMVPGSTIDRLWFDHDGELKWIPVTINPRHDGNYVYRDLCQVETAWHYGNLKDVDKYWHSIKLHTENLSGAEDTSQTIKVEYKVDEETSWTTAGYVDTSPMEEIDLSSNYDVTGYRIKFRFTLHTADDDETPRIVAYVVKGVVRVDVKKGWTATVLLTPDRDLNNQPDLQADMEAQLDTWADSNQTPAPLTMRHVLSYYDNKKVFIDPASYRPMMVELNETKGQAKRKYDHIATFNLYEV